MKYYFPQFTKNSGIENLNMDHTGFPTGSGYNSLIQYCDGCWLKGVESSSATGYHFIILGTLNMEVRDSYIHEGGVGPNNSGVNFYGNYQYGANSSAKIENNIFNKDFPAIELNNSSSGFYIGYNYSYGSPSQFGTNLVTWTFDDGHAPFNIMNLYEGNIGEMCSIVILEAAATGLRCGCLKIKIRDTSVLSDRGRRHELLLNWFVNVHLRRRQCLGESDGHR